MNDQNEPEIADGDFIVDESYTQEVAIILELNQGELKSDPVLGPNLISYIKSSVSDSDIQTVVRLHLARDNKDFNEVKNLITVNP